ILDDSHGRLWIGTDRGFFRMSGDHFIRLDSTPAMPISATRRIFEDRSHRIWLATSAGIFRIEQAPDDAAPVRIPEFRMMGSNVLSISQDASGTLWFAGDSGVFRVSNDRIQPDGWLADIT